MEDLELAFPAINNTQRVENESQTLNWYLVHRYQKYLRVGIEMAISGVCFGAAQRLDDLGARWLPLGGFGLHCPSIVLRLLLTPRYFFEWTSDGPNFPGYPIFCNIGGLSCHGR